MTKQTYIVTEMNAKRAIWAQEAIQTFQEATGTEDRNAFCDLLCDMMHLAQMRSIDFDAELYRALRHFREERRGED
jgi:hypothetical protein